jgi:hypothetical protein
MNLGSQNILFPPEPNRVIDGDYFLDRIVFQGRENPFIPTKLLALHKWVYLRNTIQKGDFIAINLPADGRDQPAQERRRIENYLKILRLRIEEHLPTVLVDVTCIVSKKFNQSPVLLHCTKVEEAFRNLQNKEMTALDIIENIPNEINGMIINNLNFDVFNSAPKDIYYPPLIGSQLTTQLSYRAETIMNIALGRYQGHGLLLSDDEIQELDPIRPFVTKYQFAPRHFTLQDITIFAQLFPNIEKLSMPNSTGIDTIICKLSEFKRLKTLDIFHSDVTGITFKDLPTSLKSLNCACCKKLNDLAIVNLKNSCLTQLWLHSTNLEGIYFNALPDTLKSLSCSHCLNLRESSIAALEKTSLEDLHISICTQITGTHFYALPKTLKSLYCNRCIKLNEVFIEKLKETNIDTLDISETPIIGDSFTKLPKSLKYFSLRGCSDLQEDAILNLQNSSIVTLDISNTHIQSLSTKHLPKTLKKLICVNCPRLEIEFDHK